MEGKGFVCRHFYGEGAGVGSAAAFLLSENGYRNIGQRVF